MGDNQCLQVMNVFSKKVSSSKPVGIDCRPFYLSSGARALAYIWCQKWDISTLRSTVGRLMAGSGGTLGSATGANVDGESAECV